MTKYGLFIANSDKGYLLTPHRELAQDSLNLPFFCEYNSYLPTKSKRCQLGHPSKTDDFWAYTSAHPNIEAGAKVILLQRGPPQWIDGVYGKGIIRIKHGEIYIKVTKMISHPILIPQRIRQIIKPSTHSKALRWALNFQVSFPSWRGNFLTLFKDEYEALDGLLEDEASISIPLQKIGKEYVNSKGERVADAIHNWLRKKRINYFDKGWPDYLVETPSGGIMAYEFKSRLDREREDQIILHPYLRKIGIPVTFIRDYSEKAFKKRLSRFKLSIIAESSTKHEAKKERQSRGWPDLLLVFRNNSVILAETKRGRGGKWEKSGDMEPLSDFQVQMLKALRFRGIEVHVIRAVREKRRSKTWTLWDDTERWLLS